MKRRIFGLLACAMLLLSFAPKAIAATETIAVAEMCVTLYESTNAGGDHWTVCGPVNNLKNASLVGDTTGIVDGCQGGFPFVRSDWNDCAGSIRYANMPANYRVRFYRDVNFAGSNACFDLDGNQFYNLIAHDNIVSSWRVEGGNC